MEALILPKEPSQIKKNKKTAENTFSHIFLYIFPFLGAHEIYQEQLSKHKANKQEWNCYTLLPRAGLTETG